MSRAGRFIQDMVDLDDEYDDEPGPGPGRERRWSPDKQREWERGTGVDDRDNYNDGGREPLGETTEPSSLYRQNGAPDGLHDDDGVHYDRQPSEPSQVRCLVVLSFCRTVEPSNRRSVFNPPDALTPNHRPSPYSQLVSIDDMNAISSHAPVRHRHKKWVLLYSTLRDGISMQTLLRKAKGHAPTVLLVRDMSKHVFGAFCSESWRVSQRYFGTGETFVFRVDPDPAVWKWWLDKSNEQQNDFFLWGSPEGIAVGGAGGYAIWLDSQLCHGLSRCSATFGNSCLASVEEFPIGAVELWALE